MCWLISELYVLQQSICSDVCDKMLNDITVFLWSLASSETIAENTTLPPLSPYEVILVNVLVSSCLFTHLEDTKQHDHLVGPLLT